MNCDSGIFQNEAEGKGGRPAISFSYNIARAIIVLLSYPHYSPCSYCYEYKYY